MDESLVQILWWLLTNPNIAYLLLIVGLWSAALAWTVPGHGLPEVGAIICLTLSILGLTRLPVNIAGLILIVVSLVLFVIDLKVQGIALTIGAAVALLLGSIFLFRPEGSGPALSGWLVASATLASVGFFAFAVSAALKSQDLPVRHRPEEMIGKHGVVVSKIDPGTGIDRVGTVQLESELWSAVADQPIDVDQKVQVINLDGLKICVVPVENDVPNCAQ